MILTMRQVWYSKLFKEVYWLCKDAKKNLTSAVRFFNLNMNNCSIA